jgi:Flp pilus assembly protein TadG
LRFSDPLRTDFTITQTPKPRLLIVKVPASIANWPRFAVARDRRGSAVVEVAICLPILILVTLLFIELTNAIFLQQSMKLASYEGVRIAVKHGATIEDVTETCQSILDSREVLAYQISVDPPDFSDAPRGTLTTVTINVDKSENRLFDLLLGSENTIESKGFGLKE